MEPNLPNQKIFVQILLAQITASSRVIRSKRTLKSWAKPHAGCSATNVRRVARPSPKPPARSSFGNTPRGPRSWKCWRCWPKATASVRLSRVKGIKEDTILRWLREAARHADGTDEVLMKDFHLKRAQMDGLWSFVATRAKKRLSGER